MLVIRRGKHSLRGSRGRGGKGRARAAGPVLAAITAAGLHSPTSLARPRNVGTRAYRDAYGRLLGGMDLCILGGPGTRYSPKRSRKPG